MFRATLRGMLARKARLLLTSLAVMLAALFVSAAMVLTNSLGDATGNLLADAYSEIDVVVQPEDRSFDSGGTHDTVPAEIKDLVEGVPEAERTFGNIEGFVNALDVRGDLVGNFAPNMGFAWNDDDPSLELLDGRGPVENNEVAVSTLFESTAGLGIGDTVTVYSGTAERAEYDIVGTYGWPGGRDSFAGETSLMFTVPSAQELMFGGEDAYTDVLVQAADGTSAEQLRDIIRGELSAYDDVEVVTGEEASEAMSEELSTITDVAGWIFLGFGLIAVFVSIFLIYNTFNIVVAQRLKELALMRALGASRKQVKRSVLLEALVVGLIASIIGLGLGVLAGYGLSNAAANFALGGIDVPFNIPLSAVLWAFGVGVGVTLISALIPARRASKVPPVAAMRDAATPDKSILVPTILGSIITAGGIGLIIFGLQGQMGGFSVQGTFIGMFALFIGATLLTPLLSRPIVGLLGRLMAWGMPGKLGRQNASRNPRRTAITASAIMIGVALVTAIATMLSSVKASTADFFEDNIDAELIVGGVQTGPIPPTFEAERVSEIGALSDVDSVADMYFDFTQVDENMAIVYSSQNMADTFSQLEGDVDANTLNNLAVNEVILNENNAERYDVSEGDTLTLQLSRGEEQDFRVASVFTDNDLLNGLWVAPDHIADFSIPKPAQAFVKLVDGADTDAVQGQVQTIIDNEPEVSVSNHQEFVEQATAPFDFFLIAIQVLLALALIIAVIGVINTLVLSVLERTRELGLLRAVGMTRGQTTRMITIESVTIAVFGALLGIGLGVALGWIFVEGIDGAGIDTFAVPTGLIIGYLIAAIVVGFLAAIAPAVRAAKLDVLKAISYE
ncbi:ABC transporter permease [Natronoglycomyces albus]|uniref:FtsX-like permease family protein n=1 Tax=Natronoglycomyces albus TaxID=2811108 RepID=A0A895XWY1_9ACTN|nr:FtsX-like permease family protein [Natronoglycomyces albus]QSB06730.1 FtsX-like permease family protein [Natronoglycomyces albus]